MIDTLGIADELIARLSSARNEPSSIFAKKILRELADECIGKINQGVNITKHVIVASNAFSELAQIENNIRKRREFRRKSIQICKGQIDNNKYFDSNFAINFADKSVDLFYDQFVREERSVLNTYLADAKTAITKSFQNEDNSNLRVQLLSQNSSVLRCQSLISSFKDSQSRCYEALRSSEKAVCEAPDNPNSYLSLGQSLWHVARRVGDHSKYFACMNKAEDALIKAQTNRNPVSSLVLARFYRQTYRPALAISTWHDYSNYESRNKRRLLAESFLAGEAAMQLWYSNFDSSNEVLSKVVVVLREAVDSGYENARIFMALASVEAALGNIVISNTILKRLYNGYLVDWQSIIEKVRNIINSDDVDLLEKGFAIGVSDSSVWNALGTYAKTFLNDKNVAIHLYEIGRHLNPKNYILLTNVSRVLVEKGDEESLSLAAIYLNQAKNYSNGNKAFVWWRNVEQLLFEAKGKKQKYNTNPPLQKLNFNNIYQRFQFLVSGPVAPLERGKLFELLFYDLLALTFGSEVIQGRHRVAVAAEREIDAAFECQHNYYRVELKWEGRPIGPDEFDSFYAKLKTAEVRGLFVSMSGFTEGAINTAHDIGKNHTIILFDGDDIKSIFEGKNRFELVLEQKIDIFRRTGNPYAKQRVVVQPAD